MTLSTRPRIVHEDLVRESASGLDIPDGRSPLGDAPPTIRVATLSSRRVGGDFIELFRHGEHGFDLLIGDAMGSDADAMQIGAATRGAFRDVLDDTTLLGGPPQPRSIVAEVQARLAPGLYHSGSFVTLCFARIDARRRQFVAVDCGHMPTLHYQRSHGRCRRLSGESMPLGFSLREVQTQGAVHFAGGDVFVFYTDGLTEARNDSGRIFGIARLSDVVEAHAGLSPEELAETLYGEVRAFAGEGGLTDDVACVVAKVGDAPTPGHPLTFVTEVPAELSELAALRSFVREVGRDHARPALDETRLDELELAVNEAASNIMIHAYRDRPSRLIRATAEVDPNRLQIRLSHDGVPFDPAAARPPSFDGSREGGFGVYLIAQSVENVTYTQSGDGLGHVLLTKSLRAPDPR